MGKRKLAPVKALKAVTAPCQESIDTLVEAVDPSMRVHTPTGVISAR